MAELELGSPMEYGAQIEGMPDLQKIGMLADDYREEEGYSEDEGIEDYKKGGYHTVYVGEVLNDRYVILQKLGWGHFSTVWLARDVKFDTYVAIKVQKSAPHYLEAAFDEVEILQKAVKHSMDKEWLDELKDFYKGKKLSFNCDDCHVVQLLNAFIYTGDYGRHFCMVFEILGVNLLEIIKRYDYRGIPLKLCRKMAKQCLLGLHYLHKHCGIIHTDVKPENVLVCLDQSDLKEIYDNGQLHRHRNMKTRLRKFQRQMKLMDGEEISESDAETATEEPKPEETPQKAILISTEEDLEKEYQRLIQVNNITNKKERKNLRKKLKQKLKKNRAKGHNKPRKDSEAQQPAIISKPRIVNGRHIDNGEKGGLNYDFKIKIADLGNGCWSHHHFQPEIQTRQYRSPEVILGINYTVTADIWSFACMLFEMLTGDFLFDPKKDVNYRKSTDHLALIMETLGPFPVGYATSGTNSKKFFDAHGNLNKIPSLHFMGLKDVMMKRHGIKASEAEALADFLEPMLNIHPEKRASAAQMLNHHWLDMDTEDFFATEEDIREAPYLYDKRYVDHSKFDKVVNEDEFDADNSYCLKEDPNDESDDEYADMYDRETKVLDRSFKQIYVGYADGIDLNGLDSTANWQFSRNGKGN